MRALPNPNLRIGSEWRPDAPTRDFDRVIPRADGRDHQVKSLLSVPARPSAWTLSHPARRNDWASLSNISTVPSAATFSCSMFIRPMPGGTHRRTHRSPLACCPRASSASCRYNSKIPALEVGPAPRLLPTRLFGPHPGKLEDPRIGAGAAAAFEPVQHLRGGVDLVVVPAFGECRQLVQILRELRRIIGQVDKAILDHRGLRVHAHYFVRLRLIAGDGVEAVGDQLLDQLGTVENYRPIVDRSFTPLRINLAR